MIKKGLRKVFKILVVVFCVLLAGEITLRAYGWILLAQRDYGLKRGDEVFTILCLGESTTMLGGKDSYPSQLQTILSEQLPDRNIKVINKGLAGDGTDVILDKVPTFLEEFSPDLVISMMGINDSLQFLEELSVERNGIVDFFRKLKIVKVFALLKQNMLKKDIWTPRTQVNEEKKETPTTEKLPRDFSRAPRDYQKKYLIAQYCSYMKEYEKAEKLYRHLLARDECDLCVPDFRFRLIETLYEQRKFDAMIQEIKHVPYFWFEDLHIMDLCAKPKYFKAVADEINKLIKENEKSTFYYDIQANCHEAAGDHINASKFRKMAADIQRSHFNRQTKNNYIKLHNILKLNKIKQLYVQYALLDVNSLKQFFITEPDYQEINFVDNKRIFIELVKKNGYNRYFTDKFAGSFGHCTKEGNRVLAENIAKTLIKYNFIY